MVRGADGAFDEAFVAHLVYRGCLGVGAEENVGVSVDEAKSKGQKVSKCLRHAGGWLPPFTLRTLGGRIFH